MALTPRQIKMLKENDYSSVTGNELLKLDKRPPGFFFVAILPGDLQRYSFEQQFSRFRRMTRKAIELKADVIIDASSGDHLHTYPAGVTLAKKLQSSNIKRFVVFDGGHHIAGLPLEPEALLVPVTNWQGELYLDHAFTRDAIKISDLRRVMSTEDIQSYVAYFPRLGLTIKNGSGMAGLAKQALLKANEETLKPVKRPIDVTRAVGRSVERRGAVFTSVEVPVIETPGLAANRAESLISETSPNSKPRKVYLGVTYGVSSLLGFDRPPTEKEADIDARLHSRIKSLEILTEPFSGKDIYARKLFHWD